MIPNELVETCRAAHSSGINILYILMLIIYVGILVLVISFLIRMVKYFKTAGNEQKLIRLELGKLADEVQQLRQKLQGGKDTESSAR